VGWEKKETLTTIVHDISKELAASDEELLKGIIKEVLSDKRVGRDEHLRRHEQ